MIETILTLFLTADLGNAVIPAPKVQIVAVAKATAVQAWLAQPRNVGSCPCSGVGGCHCQPHSLCAGGGCASHNPLLGAKAEVAAPVVTFPVNQACPNGQCPVGRQPVFPRLFGGRR